MLRKFIAILMFCLFSDALSINYPKQFITFDYQYANSFSEINYRNLFVNNQFDDVFAKGSGNRSLFKLSYNRLIFNDIYLGAAFLISTENSEYDLFKSEIIGVNGELFNGTFSKSMELIAQNINASIFAEKFILSNLSLQIGADFSLLNYFKYHFSEKIIFPEEEGVFLENYRRTRNEQEGSLDKLSTWNLFANIKYFFPMNQTRNLFIFPQLSYNYQFYSDDVLRVSKGGFGFGLGLSYLFNDKLEANNDKTPKEVPVDFNAMITISGIENGFERYIDSVEVISNQESKEVMCNLSTMNFNIIASNLDLIREWKLKIFTDKNEFSKEIMGGRPLPAFISWDIYKDDELKKTLKLFAALSSHFPPSFSFGLNYQLIIISETGYVYSTEIKKVKLFLRN